MTIDSRDETVRDDFTWPSATPDDFAILERHIAAYKRGRGQRIIDRFKLLQTEGVGGFPISRYRHGLLTATLAAQAGMDDEYVVCALLHDFAEPLSWDNHAEIAAEILGPYVSEANSWMIRHHTLFWYNTYMPGEMTGISAADRERFRGHPVFARTAEFAERFDTRAFDPALEPMPLEAFENKVLSLFGKPANTIHKIIMPAAV